MRLDKHIKCKQKQNIKIIIIINTFQLAERHQTKKMENGKTENTIQKVEMKSIEQIIEDSKQELEFRTKTLHQKRIIKMTDEEF